MSIENKKIENLEKLIARVRPYLRRYLEERNIEINSNGWFRCINPKHMDSNPSCHFVKDSGEEAFNCFACGAKGSILAAAHMLEGKPLTGQEFITDNLAYLAEKYGIEFSTLELSPEELLLRRTYRAYDDAADIVSEYQPLEYISKRGWAVTVCTDLKVGSVRSYGDFLSRMESRGYDKVFCEEIDLNGNLFNENMLIFSIRDERGRTVGFSSRDMNHTKETKRPKFINTSAKCQLYSKSAILYGMDIGKQFQPPIYIFEGYPDYVTAYKYGIKNVCAIGGTALTREHIDLIKHLSIRDIILALDGDSAGQDKTEKILDEYFGGDETLNVKVLKIDESDPDEFIIKNGAEAFRDLPLLTPFQWRLARFAYDARPEFICDKMIPFIISDPMPVHQEAMCKELAEKTGITLKSITKQVDRIINEDEAQKDGAVQSKIRQLVNDLKYHKGDPATLLEVTAGEIRQISSEARESINSTEEVLSSIDVIKRTFEDRKEGLQGWRTGYEYLDKAISGIPKQDAMITFAGDANVGKTGYMFELALRLARYNENIMVLFMTIDDSRQQAIARLVALEGGLRINQVSHPIQNTVTEEDREKLRTGWGNIKHLIDNNRFSIKDNSHGDTLDFAEGWIRWAKAAHPDREICFFLDNFHKLGDERGADERIRFKHASSRIHGMKNKLNITAICTMELRKMIGGTAATRPQLQDISESKQMEYDNNLIGMVYSDLHARREEAKVYWEEEVNGAAARKPIFEIEIQKNKISDFKDILYYKFAPDRSKFHEVGGEQVTEWKKEYQQALKQIRDKKHPEAGHNPFLHGHIHAA